MAVRPRYKRLARWLLGSLGALFCALGVAYLAVDFRYASRIQPVEKVVPAPVALVFGAGLAQQGMPSPMLAARVGKAVELYTSGKVSRVLLSGNSERHHDEIGAMRKAAQGLGLPPSALMLDAAGDSTFDSCLRARDVYGVERVILVTQAFHMPRALWVANGLGLDAYGVETNPQAGFKASYALRELFARPWAMALVLLQPAASPHPRPTVPDNPSYY